MFISMALNLFYSCKKYRIQILEGIILSILTQRTVVQHSIERIGCILPWIPSTSSEDENKRCALVHTFDNEEKV